MRTVLSIANSENIIIEAFTKEGFDVSDPKIQRVITNLKKANRQNAGEEEILLDKEAIKVLDKLSIGVLVDSRSEIIYNNGYLCTLLGYTEKEFSQLDQFSIIYPDDRIAAKRLYDLIYSGAETDQTLVHRKYHKNGSLLWIRSQLTGLKNNKGEVTQLLITHVDLTSLMHSHQKNDEQKFIYKSLVENTTEGLEIISLNSLDAADPNHKLILRNHYMKKMLVDDHCLYLKPAEFKDIMPEYQNDGRPSVEVIRTNTEKLRDERYFKGELDFLIDGEKRICHYSIRLISMDDRVFMIRNYRDITDIKEKERALIENEMKFRGFVEALPGAISIINTQGEHQYISPQSKEIFGYPNDFNFIGTLVTDFFPESVRDELTGIVKMLEKHSYWTKVLPAKKHDGTIFPLEINGRLIKGEDRKDDLIITYFIDVSEKEQRRREVNLRKSLYETLIESSIDGIDICEIEIDKEHGGFKNARLVMRNQPMQLIFGSDKIVLSPDEMQEFIVLPEGGGINTFLENDVKPLIEKRYHKHDFKIKIIDGSIKDFTGVFRIIDVNDKLYLIRIFNDLTEEKAQKRIISQQLGALKERQMELEKYIESNLQLENFAYIASHDLKAPLRTVLSFSQLIKRSSYDKLEEKDKEFLDIVIQSTNNMMLLIEDLLTFSRVNTKKVQLHHINLAELVETISMDLRLPIDQSGAELKWNLQSEYINADQVKMVQIFENLLRNAIKFVPNDRKPIIQIIQTESDQHYHFQIVDNGIGIKRDHFDKIFAIFSKLHSKDIYDGTGLGLSICSKIVEQHHGKIWVESEWGQGSTFHFTISKHITIED